MFATWSPFTLSLHRPARSRWYRAVIPLGTPHKPWSRLSRGRLRAESFARDDNDDRSKGPPVQCLRLDPDDVGDFFGIYRHGDPRQSILDLCEGKEVFKRANGRDVAREIQRRADSEDKRSTEPEAFSPWDDLGFSTEEWAASEETFWHTIFETACWSKTAVEEARSKYMEHKRGWINDSKPNICQLPDYLASIQRRSEFMIAAAALYAGHLARQWLNSTRDECKATATTHLGHATAKSLGFLVDDSKRIEKVSQLTLIAHCLAKRPHTTALGQSGRLSLQSLADDVRRATRYSILSGLPYRPELGLLYNDMLNETTALIRYNLGQPADGNPLKSSAARPLSNSGENAIFSPFQVTNELGYEYCSSYAAAEDENNDNKEDGRATRAIIMDLPVFSGYFAPRAVVQDIAAGLRADVIHITSGSIAHLLECPLPLAGNGFRIPTDPISNLRFRVAKRSGWLNSSVQTLEMPENGKARVLKRGYWNSINTTWPDFYSQESGLRPMDALKVDAGLNMVREMKKSSEMQDPTHSLRPTLIHIHDFNTLCMDESDVMEKILLWTESLRSEGWNVSLIGTCSISRASQQYFRGADFLNAKRFCVISLPASLPGVDSSALEERESLLCNAEMIAKLIVELHEPQDVDSRPRVKEYLSAIAEHFGDSTVLCRGVLPLQLVERIATTTVGILKAYADTRPATVERLTQALSEALSLFAGSDTSCDGGPPSSQNRDMKTLGEPRSHPFLTVNSQDTDTDSIEQSLLDGLIKPEDIRTTFDGIHLPQSTIKSIRLLTELALLQPEEFSYGVLAAERLRGCLLYGPPGTGKTLLAKAVAKESGANVLEITAASIQHEHVGVSENLVRSLFALAKRKDLSPLVIFIDEADSLLGSRDGVGDTNGWRRSVVNQFLREMDGLEASSAFVMVATNRPFDLDEAVLRRLPRKLLVDLPLEADRAAILMIHLAGEELDPAVSVDDIARRTPLYSGSDLKNVCVAAAMACVYESFGDHWGSGKGSAKASSRGRRRVLSAAHFDIALSEISASVNVDMASLKGIKKFDEKYGDAGAQRKRKTGVGFGGNAEVTDADVPRVRT